MEETRKSLREINGKQHGVEQGLFLQILHGVCTDVKELLLPFWCRNAQVGSSCPAFRQIGRKQRSCPVFVMSDFLELFIVILPK